MPTRGFFNPAASPLTVVIPIRRPVKDPGPLTTAKPSKSENSSPEKPEEFYEKVDKLLAYFIAEGRNSLTVNFSLDYFNTGSARSLYLLMTQLKEHRENGMDVSVNWYYKINDEDMLLSGKNFSSYTQLDLKLIPTSPMKY